MLITSNKKISTLYYILLNGGYNFYHYEKSDYLIKTIESFKNNNLAIYKVFVESLIISDDRPYVFWPYLFIMECTTFFIDEEFNLNFSKLLTYVKQRKNIDRTDFSEEKLWNMVNNLSKLISETMKSKDFEKYYNFVEKYIIDLKEKNNTLVYKIEKNINLLNHEYLCDTREIEIIVDPIKCVYSADQFYESGKINIILGELNELSVYHEFLHEIVEKKYLQDSERKYDEEEKLVRKLSQDLVKYGKLDDF